MMCKVIIYALLTAATLAAVSACTSTQYVPVQSERTDSIISEQTHIRAAIERISENIKATTVTHDTVREYRTDSVIIVVNEAGNVISRERYAVTDKQSASAQLQNFERLQQRYDSVIAQMQLRYESILQSSTQTPIPVEAKLTTWQRICQNTGSIAIGILIAVLIAAVIWLIKKFRK